ncbi:MAG: hypothetical protein AAF636_19605 [Pseudomonadota bacterium]
MYRLFWASVTLCLSACGPGGPLSIVDPSEVTVQAALADISSGLSQFRTANAKSGANTGLLVDEVTVTLNLKASATDSTKLVIDTKDVRPPVLAGGNLSSSAEAGRVAVGERSNTVTIRLKNVTTAQLNSLGQSQEIVERPGGGIGLGKVNISSQPGNDGFQPLPGFDCDKPESKQMKDYCDALK